MAGLVLGPVLGRVTGDRATIWVKTDGPAEVSVEAGAATRTSRAFSAYDHHYALFMAFGLIPGIPTAYRVRVDGAQVWPPPGSPPPGRRCRRA